MAPNPVLATLRRFCFNFYLLVVAIRVYVCIKSALRRGGTKSSQFRRMQNRATCAAGVQCFTVFSRLIRTILVSALADILRLSYFLCACHQCSAVQSRFSSWTAAWAAMHGGGLSGGKAKPFDPTSPMEPSIPAFLGQDRCLVLIG